MHSNSFQNAGLKLHCYVSDFPRQVVERLSILPSPGGVRNKGLTTQKVNSTCICTVFKIKSLNFTGTSRTLRERSCKGWWFYRTSIGVRHEGLIRKLEFDVHLHSFQNATLKLHSSTQPLPGTGRREVDDSTVFPPRRGQKWRVNHSKNVNATCIRTVFKVHSWNFTGTSMTPRDRSGGWRFYRTPEGPGIKG